MADYNFGDLKHTKLKELHAILELQVSGFVPVVSGKTQIVLFDYFACKAEVFISPFGACHLFSLTNALQRDRCVVRARVLGVHVLPEGSIAARVLAASQPRHPSWGFCTDAFCADVLRPRTLLSCGFLLSKYIAILRQSYVSK